MYQQGREGSRGNGHHSNRARMDQRAGKERENMRQGNVYEHRTGHVRTVTPESAGPLAQDITALPSPTSFPSHVHGWDPSTSVSNTDEESTIETRRRKVKKKSKHKGDVSSDASPNSFLGKTRKRLGSITTSSAFTPTKQEELTSSIGYPSVVQASVFPDLTDVRQQLPRTPLRTYSSENEPFASATSLRSPLLLDSNSSRILQLMKTTCGRMHGILFYRPVGTTSWDSGYCAINTVPGSLVCQTKGEKTSTQVLIPDLRGCTVRTRYDTSSNSTYLSVVLPVSGLGMQLRPPVPETFDSWLAALLCWQPLRPRGIYNKMTKPQSVSMSDRKTIDQRRVSDVGVPRSTAIVKAGQITLWNGPLPTGTLRSHLIHSDESHGAGHDLWQRVGCTLHENGTFKLLSEDATPIRTVRLCHLARCSVQRLDDSVLNAVHCLAIFPQYTIESSIPYQSTPIVLRLDSKVAYEAWFVLLRALTVPELYGPEVPHGLAIPENVAKADNPSLMRGMFRIERALYLKITEAKFNKNFLENVNQHVQQNPAKASSPLRREIDMYADVILGRDLRARTNVKPCAKSAFWAEEFSLEDLPSIMSNVTVAVKLGNHGEQEWTMITKEGYELPDENDTPELDEIEVASHDPVCGQVEIAVNDLEQEKEIEKWWPLIDNNGLPVGQILMKICLNETVVLLESEYSELSTLLHKFDNSLTTQIAQVLGSELKQLSDVLLDIFQVSDSVEDWINNLIEEEIDGIYKETPPVRMRFSGRIHSNDSYESAEHRELLVRDLSRSATMEANLLFRGNSLVTKALDAHMRRLGRDYLVQTLADKLRRVNLRDPNCEVDPARTKSTDQRDRNWNNLITITSDIWKAIASSASTCPPGMRVILKHIRSCAEDRYGSFIRTVKYTSVSGFLFLRFFCPAILNPKLFGLIEEHPRERPRRTFTLIAKSLIVLANMSKFGQKEPWMEPMNKFLTSATTEFKNFIEEICSYDISQPAKLLQPQYQAPGQVKARLPLLSREGLPSLPFLLDSPKLHANLVEIWLNNAPEHIGDTGIDDCLQSFHGVCLRLRKRTQECLSKAEKAEQPDRKLERQWQEILSKQNRGQLTTALPRNRADGPSPDPDNGALPSPSEDSVTNNRYHYFEAADQRTEFEVTSSSPIPSGVERHVPSKSQRHGDVRNFTNSANSSNVSIDRFEEGRTLPLPSSRDGSSKKKFFDITSRRKGKHVQSDNQTRDNDDNDP